MTSATLEILNQLGLHARAASLLVKTAAGFAASITIATDAKEADCKSIMSVMLLEATKGTRVVVSADGEDETAAVEAITNLVNDKFGEDE